MNGMELLRALEAELTEASERLAEADSDESASETIDEIQDIVAAAIEVLEEIDLSKLAASVKPAELADAINVEDASDAIEEGKPLDAVDISELPDAFQREELLEAIDVLDLASEVDELTDEVDDVTDSDIDDAGFDSFDVSSSGDGPDFDQDWLETTIQDAVLEAVEEFRGALLKTHATIRKLVEENRERFDSVAEKQPDSRNPSAFSTMPARNITMTTTAVPSTIPRRVRHSSIVNKPQIYGRRFEREVDDE